VNLQPAKGPGEETSLGLDMAAFKWSGRSHMDLDMHHAVILSSVGNEAAGAMRSLFSQTTGWWRAATRRRLVEAPLPPDLRGGARESSSHESRAKILRSLGCSGSLRSLR